MEEQRNQTGKEAALRQQPELERGGGITGAQDIVGEEGQESIPYPGAVQGRGREGEPPSFSQPPPFRLLPLSPLAEHNQES